MTIHHPASREEWLSLRHRFVSSTESSALFGLNPYLTAFELFYAKRAAEPTQFEASERMQWGLRLEDAIARGLAEDYGIKVRKLNSFVSRDGMGASFDYEVVGVKDDVTPEDTSLQGMYRDLGPGILEIKNVDWLVYRNNWTNDDGRSEAPPHIEIQVQHQLHVIERSWAAIGVLVGGNSLKMLVRERDPVVGERLALASERFWKRIEANKPPKPVMPADADVVAKIYNHTEEGKLLDAQSDSETALEIERLAKEYEEASIHITAHENRKKAAKASLLVLVNDAERVLCRDGYTITARMVAETEVKAFTRASYRNFTVRKKKETKGE
jgi:hypothetical protein